MRRLDLGAALGLAPEIIREYVDAEPLSALEPRCDVVELARDTAEVVGHWCHFAILELIHVESFKPDVRWFAQVLGLTTDEVSLAVSRLLRLRLPEMRGATWVDLSGDAVARFDDFTRAALESFFEQVRGLAAGGEPGRAKNRRVELVKQ